MTTITWSQIEAECGDYRAGFVATFRKYEGRDTDERDGSNRPVKVTVNSFARHMKIPEATFKDWVKRSSGRPTRPTERTAADRVHQGARNLPATEKAKLAAELLDDGDVIAAVARAPETRKAVRRAITEVDLSSLPDRDYQPSHTETPIDGMAAELAVATAIRKARRSIADAIENACDATFDADGQSILLEDVGRLRAGADHLESAITSTEADFDAALADLLGGSDQ